MEFSVFLQSGWCRVTRALLLVAIFALSVFVFPVTADVKEDFEALRTAYEANRARLVTPFNRLYLSRLQRLEKLYIDQELYEDAERCRDERLRIESAIKAVPPQESPEEIIFTSSEAVLRGGVKLTGDWIENWTQGSAVGWKLPGLQKGGYEVFLEYGGIASPIEVKLQEASYNVRGILPRANAATRASIGFLRISDKNASLEFTVVQSSSASTALRVKALILVPQWP